MSGDARDRALREYWKDQYDFIDVKTTTASFDAIRGEHRLVMDGAARMQWKDGWYETDGTAVGYKADFSRDSGSNRDAPFAVAFPRYTRTIETILLPPGASGFRTSEKADVNETVAGVEYRRTAKIVGNIVTIEKSERSIAAEFAAADAPAAQKTLRDLAERTVYVARPDRYRQTEKEVDAVLASTPANAYEFNERGYRLIDRGKYDEAIADFDRAIALDPKFVWAFANRGLAHAWKDEPTAAAKDLDAATALDAANPVVFRARGLLAERRKDWAAAVAAFNRSLQIDPDNGFAWGHLVTTQRSAGNTDAALADAAQAIRRNPAAIDMYLLRANMLRGKRPNEAIAEAGALMKANPDSVDAHVGAARILDALGKKEEALRAFDRAIAIGPDSLIYINRAEIRPRDDVAGRRADLEAAAKLDPESGVPIVGLAKLHEQVGNTAAALAAWSEAIAVEPDAPEGLIGRGVLHARAGRDEAAAKDFAAARALTSEPHMLNSLCWAKATAGGALESALADCNAALAKAPDSPAFLDSRALVYLKLGQLDKAMTDYDAALKGAPEQTASLYGRAVVWARRGDKAKSDVDAAAALSLNPDVERRFAEYRIKR